MPVAFMLGQIKLGLLYEIPQDSLIFPQDIVNVPRENGDDKNLIKVLTLLQSLDEDKNPENGIKIPLEVHKKLTTFIDIKEMEIEEIQELVENQLERNITFKEPVKVLLHLQKSMNRYNLPQLKSKILEEFETVMDNNSTDNNSSDNNTEDNSTDNNSSNNDTEDNTTNDNNATNNNSEDNTTDNNTPDNNSTIDDKNSTQESNRTVELNFAH